MTGRRLAAVEIPFLGHWHSGDAAFQELAVESIEIAYERLTMATSWSIFDLS
jgi:hypothetical protein